jgi:hypothetical protein
MQAQLDMIRSIVCFLKGHDWAAWQSSGPCEETRFCLRDAAKESRTCHQYGQWRVAATGSCFEERSSICARCNAKESVISHAQLSLEDRLHLWRKITHDERLVLCNTATSHRALKFLRLRLVEIDAGRGPSEVPGERTGIQQALGSLTANGIEIYQLQTEDDAFRRRLQGGDPLTDRELCRLKTVSAALAIANGTGRYNEAFVTQAMLPYLVLFA